MAQRISVDGVPQGDNVLLSGPAGFEDESPWVAAGDQSVALAYTNGTAGVQEVRFATFDQTTLSPQSSVLTLSDGLGEAVFPRVFWNEDHYVVTWFERTAPTKAIYGARVSESGEVLTPATALSAPGNFRSRYPFMLPLGDRILLIYADDRDQNQGYELYSRLIASDLQPLSTEQRLTNAAFDSIFPVATFGPEGNVGILFRDDRDNGEHHVWFTQLGCIAGTPNPG
jgi:hypothetical protein